MNLPLNIYDSLSQKFVYVNSQFLKLSNLSEAECYKEIKEFDALWMDDQEFFEPINQIQQALSVIYKKYIVSNSNRLYYMINFRLKEKGPNNNFKYFLVQSSVLKWDKNHSPALTLNLFTDINLRKHSSKVILTVFHCDESDKDWKLIFEKEFLRIPQMLASREKEILICMLEDKSAKDIAIAKNISIYTVRSHWRSILQKTNCASQKELKHLALEEGWV